MLEKISRLRNGHVIRSFGGNRLGDRYEEMDDVVKTFLEFCPGGNGDKFLPESNAEEEEVAGEGLEEVGRLFTFLFSFFFFSQFSRGK